MADRIKGITIEIGGDTTGLSKSLSSINKEIKDTQSQLKDVERLLKLDPGNTELLAQKQRLLKESVEETKEKLEALKEAQEQVQKQFEAGEIGVEQYEGLQREIVATEEELKKLEEQAKKSNTALQEISALGGKFTKAGKSVEAVGEKIMPLSATVTALGTAAAVTAADFESAMSKVKAISGATEEEMEQLNQKAIEMGASTKFSAKESADAFTYMAMAGWDAQQMIDGIGGIMSLAAADGLDLASTSDIVTDALTAFGLKASDSSHFADVLAQASSSANTNVSMLGESFKYVAPIAGTLGYTAEDTAIALGIMANAGIKGSQAGTTLKTALANMASPSKNMVGVMEEFGLSLENTDGSMKTLQEVMDMLRESMAVTTEEQVKQNYAMHEQEMAGSALGKSLATMTEEQKKSAIEYSKGIDLVEAMSEKELKAAAESQLGIELTKERTLTAEEYYSLCRSLGEDVLNGISESEQAAAAATLFGKEAMAGMLNVINASEEDYNKLSEAIYGCEGRADDMAETMMDNTSGAIEQAKGAIETLAIMVGDKLTPAIRAVADFIASLAEKASGMSDTTMTIIVVIGAIIAALGPLLIVIGKVLQSVGAIMSYAPQLASMLTTIQGAIAALSGPIGIAVAAIVAFIAAFVTLYNTNENFRTKVNAVWEQICSNISKIIKQITSIFDSFKKTATELWNRYGDDIKSITSSVFDTVAGVIETAMNLISDILAVVLAAMQGDWSGTLDAIKNLVKNFTENIDAALTSFGKAIENAIRLALQIIQDLWIALQTKIVEIVKAIVEAVVAKFGEMKEKAIETFAKLKDGLAGKIATVKETIVNGISEAVKWIENLPQKAVGWGKDLISGFVNGITSTIGKVVNAVKNVANSVTQYLHFSRPDKGPLRNYEEWMPDMMRGLADGIRNNMWMITEQLENLTGNMSLSLNGVADMTPAPVMVRNYNQTIVDGKLVAESVDERLGELL